MDGDIDVVIDGVTMQDFYKMCRKSKCLRSMRPFLISGRGNRPPTVKMVISRDIDATSLLERGSDGHSMKAGFSSA